MERAPPLPSGQLPPQAPAPPLPPSPAHLDGVVTLLVKHLPDALSADTLLRLFLHYGASDVRPCVAGRLKNCAFVDFKDDVQATRAQSQLHRLQFFGKTLAVERAKPFPVKAASDKVDAKGAGQEENAPPLPPYPHPHEQGGLQPMMSTGINSKTTAVSGFKLEPIAPSLGVDYPFPPHLEYAYPPPDGNILTNIVNALIAVPRFYTQVLHLMNKMNLPAPFRPALPTPPLPPPPPEPAASKPQDRDLSSDESELESSEDDGTVEGKEVNTSTSHVLKKRKVLAKDAEGAKPTSLVPKERALIKKRQPVLQINISAKGSSREHAPVKEHTHDEGKMQLDKAEPSLKDNTVEPRMSATREELVAGRMPLNEILVLPMFKNYTKGIPTPVLYVKNLAKDVTQDDLYYVFGAVFPKSEDIRSQLSVKLMQEGRMRGQAFVTFPSTDLAEDALSTVHGFILKGKPMVVQFGRNPAAVKPTTD